MKSTPNRDADVPVRSQRGIYKRHELVVVVFALTVGLEWTCSGAWSVLVCSSEPEACAHDTPRRLLWSGAFAALFLGGLFALYRSRS